MSKFKICQFIFALKYFHVKTHLTNGSEHPLFQNSLTMKPVIHHENNFFLKSLYCSIKNHFIYCFTDWFLIDWFIDWLIDWFNVDLNSWRKYSIIKRLRQNVCWLECASCKYTIDYIQNDICPFIVMLCTIFFSLETTCIIAII